MIDEQWDIYDEKKNKTGEILERNSSQKLEENQYHLVSSIVIVNEENKILITQRSEMKKKYPLYWEIIGGACLRNETSKDGIIREVNEEIGIIVNKSDLNLFKTVINDNKKYIKDIYVYKNNINNEEINFQDKEVRSYIWINYSDLKNIQQKLIPTIDINEKDLITIFNRKDKYKW